MDFHFFADGFLFRTRNIVEKNIFFLINKKYKIKLKLNTKFIYFIQNENKFHYFNVKFKKNEIKLRRRQ